MDAITKQINTVVAQSHETEQTLVYEIVKRFLPDDVASPEDLSNIATARKEYRRNETIAETEINWE